eukprot:4605666-Pleurochrysis_carterae.AAC.1
MLTDPGVDSWHLTFNIDGTAISGKRKFTHAMVTLAAMYKQRKAVLTELKGATLAIAQHHDDGKGLLVIMRRKQSAPGKGGSE